jgi:hypothetical protein
MRAHRKGREGNLSVETQIRSFRVPGPLDGAPNALVAGHPLCHFSLALVALGGSNPTGGFHLRTLSIGRHMAIM